MPEFTNESKLATLAATLSYKVNKSEAQALIVKLATCDDEWSLADRELQLASLYNFFRPTAPKKPKTAFDFVAKGKADSKEVRVYLQFPWSDGDNLYSSDGGIAIKVEGVGLPEGFYSSEHVKLDNCVNQIGVAPNFEQLFNGKRERTLLVSEVDISTLTTQGTGKHKRVSVSIIVEDVIVAIVSKKYLDIALSGLGDTPYISFNGNKFDSLILSNMGNNRKVAISPEK